MPNPTEPTALELATVDELVTELQSRFCTGMMIFNGPVKETPNCDQIYIRLFGSRLITCGLLKILEQKHACGMADMLEEGGFPNE